MLMKKRLLLLPFICALAYIVLTGYATGAGTATIECTGVLSSTYCGGGCHGSIVTGSIDVNIELLSGGLPVTIYNPGSSYTIRLKAQNLTSAFTLAQFGFQLAAVKTSTATGAGTLTAPGGATHVVSLGSFSVVEQTANLPATSGTGGMGTIYQVDIPWTAPATATGNVTFKGVLTAVNGDGLATVDDKYNFASFTVTESTASPVGPITGPARLCVGGTTTLSNATAGGTWTSTATSVATISTAGVVSGIAIGTSTISYDAGSSGIATRVVTVNPQPAPITGTMVLCIGSTSTLTDVTPLGVWSSSATSIASIDSFTGVASGLSGGTATISYTVPSGCSYTAVMTVDVLPVAGPISGASTVCVGQSITLAGAAIGGTWTSANTAMATVGGATGIVTGVTVGTAAIKYKLVNTCGADSVSKIMTIVPAAICAAGVALYDEREFSVSPNPNYGTFTISLPGVNMPVYCVVTDVTGRQVAAFSAMPGAVTLPLQPGVYVLCVNGLGRRWYAKVVVR